MVSPSHLQSENSACFVGCKFILQKGEYIVSKTCRLMMVMTKYF